MEFIKFKVREDYAKSLRIVIRDEVIVLVERFTKGSRVVNTTSFSTFCAWLWASITESSV